MVIKSVGRVKNLPVRTEGHEESCPTLTRQLTWLEKEKDGVKDIPLCDFYFNIGQIGNIHRWNT